MLRLSQTKAKLHLAAVINNQASAFLHETSKNAPTMQLTGDPN
jgi:hypothetical protein